MRRWAALAPAIALAVLIVIGVVALTRGGEHQTISAGALGRSAPAYALARLGGGDGVTNRAFQGRAYLINVFASWCAPCRAEHPQLLALKAQGVAMLGVDYKDTPEDAAAFLANLRDPYEIVASDPQGRFGLDLGIAGVPETFVIDAAGRIRAVIRGPLTEEAVARDVAPALAAAH